jgi:filamentous hemagglutinin
VASLSDCFGRFRGAVQGRTETFKVALTDFSNSYQSTATLSRTLNGYIDSVAGYNGTGPNGWAGVKIDSSQITGRGLDLVIPNAGSTAQQQAINQAVQYGVSKGVKVNVNIHP